MTPEQLQAQYLAKHGPTIIPYLAAPVYEPFTGNEESTSTAIYEHCPFTDRYIRQYKNLDNMGNIGHTDSDDPTMRDY